MSNTDERRGGLDRRSALKMTAAAGATAWIAPTITSQTAQATGGTCTPKCRPTSAAPAIRAEITNSTCSGNGHNKRTVTIHGRFRVDSAFACPCTDASPEIETVNCGSPFSCSSTPGSDYVEFSFTGNALLVSAGTTGTLQVRVTCPDRSGDKCPIMCTTTVTLTLSGQDEGNCKGFSPVATVRTNCN